MPRFRICTCPTSRTASMSSGTAARDLRRPLERRVPGQGADPQRAVRRTRGSRAPATPLMSISRSGRASRKFSSGTRLWPPASTLASSPCSASRASVLDRAWGSSYSRRRLHALLPRGEGDDALGGQRQPRHLHPQRIRDGIRDRRPTAAVPPSPAPFAPSGFRGVGASSVTSTSTCGTSAAVGSR